MSAAPTILSQLYKYGPEARSRETPPTPEEARRYVQDLATGHYENFSVLSRFVPADLRDDGADAVGSFAFSPGDPE